MHIPVLLKEVIESLDPKPNENFIDATVGGGGHAMVILEKNEPHGKVLGIDADPEQIKNLKLKIKNWEKRIIAVCDSFANLKEIVRENRFGSVNGILFDLGMSSWHLEESGRGFSFLKNEPLDMRYGSGILTAEKIVNYGSFQELERALRECGEEQFSKQIAREIIEARRVRAIKTTFQLTEIVKKATPAWYEKKALHPATKTFQALRIAVNGELESLKSALPQAVDILEKGGRLAVISFHSLEDRIVKNFLKEKEQSGAIKTLTKKPISASKAEITINPRARSAKLRAAIKL